MREIIFRGKRVSNGEWVYGDLINDKKFRRVSIVPNSLEELPFSEWVVEVDPSTVGQYTGLKDRNGKMIFEGDILRYLKVAGHTSTGIVKYITEFARWEYWHTQQNQGFTVLSDCDNMEVIGNIHDQKEDV